MVEYRTLDRGEIAPPLFRAFERTQVVTRCWRRENGVWVIREDPYIDDWSARDYEVLVACLKNTAATGGLVCGAFLRGALKGFVSVESAPLGSRGQYLDLSSIHVSRDLRGHGAGRALFHRAADFARARGAEKLYISAHPAVESQAFYRAMGCVEAEEPDPGHVARGPSDCQLEYVL